MCCRCRRNCCGCNHNGWNNWNSWNNRNDDIATRRILVTDLDALQNRSGNNCGCCCGCCHCNCDDSTTALIGTRNAARGCGDVSLFGREGREGREGIDFANVFNNRCSCCNKCD